MTKKQKITYYILLVIVSAVFLLAAFNKFISSPAEMAAFTSAGLPLWFMYVIGIGELFGVIGLWTRRFFRYAYEGLFLVLLGAVGTTIAFQSIVFAILPVAVAVMLGFVVKLKSVD